MYIDAPFFAAVDYHETLCALFIAESQFFGQRISERLLVNFGDYTVDSFKFQRGRMQVNQFDQCVSCGVCRKVSRRVGRFQRKSKVVCL